MDTPIVAGGGIATINPLGSRSGMFANCFANALYVHRRVSATLGAHGEHQGIVHIGKVF